MIANDINRYQTKAGRVGDVMQIDEIYAACPAVRNIIMSAKGKRGYQEYEIYKRRLSGLVGYGAQDSRIANSAAYNLVMQKLANTLRI